MSDEKKTGLSEDAVKRMETISDAVQIAAAMALQTALGKRVISDLRKEFSKAGEEVSEQDLMKAASEILDGGFKLGVLVRSCVRVYQDADKKPDTPPPANDVSGPATPEVKDDGPDSKPQP